MTSDAQHALAKVAAVQGGGVAGLAVHQWCVQADDVLSVTAPILSAAPASYNTYLLLLHLLFRQAHRVNVQAKDKGALQPDQDQVMVHKVLGWLNQGVRDNGPHQPDLGFVFL